MVIFTSRLFDVTYSPVELNEVPAASDVRTSARRLSREATLDGGAQVDDAGFSDGDRIITIAVQAPGEGTRAALQGLVEADGLQRLASADGVFEGGIERISEQQGQQLVIRFLVEQKLSA